MIPAYKDGSAGDVDYGRFGKGYSSLRRADPRIAARIGRALGESRKVLNVGAGAGSYEPRDREVTAVEPSASMRAQRPADLPPAVEAVAEDLPFDDGAFDGAMATFTVHQWPDLAKGLQELRRVTRGPIVILSCDPKALDRFWLIHYAPEVIHTEARRYPPIETMTQILTGKTEVQSVHVPIDCSDGFGEAYYARPERFLEPEVRATQSAWSFVDPRVQEGYIRKLAADLESGNWDKRYGRLRTQPEFDGSLRLITGRP